MAQLPESKRKTPRKRGPSAYQRVAEQRDKYWEATPQELVEAGIKDADLRALSTNDEFPSDEELGKRYEESFNAAHQLERGLIEVIKASAFDADSRKHIIQTIRDYGSAKECHGAIAAQHKFRGADEYHRAAVGKNRGRGKREQGPREPRLALMAQWIESHEVSEEDTYSLFNRADEIANWMRQCDPKVAIPVDRRTWEVDWVEVFSRLKANAARTAG
jgi:hypothetical protein